MIEILAYGKITDIRYQQNVLLVTLQIAGSTRSAPRRVTCVKRGKRALALKDRLRLGQQVIVRGSAICRVSKIYMNSLLVT
ncbi:hypothetical protein DB345_21205 [Spartobacteria bacterium LR76]|nr:hypothetical protein DB345_21205 [Spartobacteria bacterium LR76]